MNNRFRIMSYNNYNYTSYDLNNDDSDDDDDYYTRYDDYYTEYGSNYRNIINNNNRVNNDIIYLKETNSKLITITYDKLDNHDKQPLYISVLQRNLWVKLQKEFVNGDNDPKLGHSIII